MQTGYKESNKDLKIRKTIGREHLYANRIEDALAVFAGILRDYPDDVESLVILGDLYLASGDSSTAVQLYSRAMQHKKEDTQIEQRLQLAQVEKVTAQDSAESAPDHPEAVARLLQRLTGQSNPITEQDIRQAGDLLNAILKSPNPSDEVARRLDEIDNLMPALLELNIRQARADGRFDMADALQKIQSSLQHQFNAAGTVFSPARSNEDTLADKLQNTFSGQVVMLLPAPEQPSSRALMIKEALTLLGSEVLVTDQFVEAPPNQLQIVIACNPHAYPKLMSALAASAAARMPIIVDLDTDFEQMPLDHPNYNTQGVGTPAFARAYMSMLLLANLITVPSVPMAVGLKNNNYPVLVVPDGWSEKNPHWKENTVRRKNINLGWVGQPGQFEDVAQIRRVIVRVLREFADTQLVVVGDQHVYHLFESIPVNRRRYLPYPPVDEYPHLLDQIDILLAPFRNTPFNRSQSDKLLMEANVKGVPWVASPMPAFMEWEAGGLVAHSAEDWHARLRRLIMEDELRQSLRVAGRRAAQLREMSQLKTAWLRAVRLAQQNAASPPGADNGVSLMERPLAPGAGAG